MNCKIVGYEYKTLEVTLQPGESFYGERGSIVYVEDGIQRDAEFNNGTAQNGLRSILGGVVRSALSGESILIIHFYNATNQPKTIVLSGSCCAIVPIKLEGENLICRRGHYVGSTEKVRLNLNLNIQAIVGGLGLFQKVEGRGTVILDSKGSAIEKTLAYGESIEVDENHIVALLGFQPSQISAGWSFGNILRGEGLSLMRITGPGKLYLSPLPILPPAVEQTSR